MERLAGLKNVVATIGEVDVKRCEEGREGSDVIASYTTQCKNLTDSHETYCQGIPFAKVKDTEKCKRAEQSMQ